MGESKAPRRRNAHKHKTVTEHVLRQREGVPYEFERTVCPACSQVLEERPVRRAAA